MATYKEIAEYVLENHNIAVETCWIADVKARFGLTTRVAPNRIDEARRTNPCPEDVVQYIEEALRFYEMIE